MISRRAIDYGVRGFDTDDGDYVEYRNLPRAIATVISAGRATLHELDTVYGVSDLYRLLEIVSVDNPNQRIASRPRK